MRAARPSGRGRWLVAGAAVLALMITSCTPGGGRDQGATDPDATTQGSADVLVGPSGAYQKDVSLELPAFHDLEPALALHYDSSVGPGIVGVGWRLSGLSEVRRASKGLGPPGYDAGDVFQLDGADLVACSSASIGPSCAHPPLQPVRSTPSPRMFATRAEGFIRIQFQPTHAGGRWTVWRKDGTQLVYLPGATTTSGPYTWELSTVRDTQGNEVRYTYGLGAPESGFSAERLLRDIRYNEVAVHFYYEARPDASTYANGEHTLTAPPSTAPGLVERSRRLKSVVVKVGKAVARAYTLRYESRSAAAADSLLVEVQQYGDDARVSSSGDVVGSALPPTSFRYGQSATPDEPWTISSFPVSSRDVTPSRPPSIYAGRLLPDAGLGALTGPVAIGDFDGDGRTDWNQLGWKFGAEAKTLIFVTSLAGPPSTGGVARTSEVSFVPDEEWTAESRGYQNPIVLYSKSADLNGDGRTDLILAVGYGYENVSERVAIVPALSRGDGTFALRPALRTPVDQDLGVGLSSCQAGDLNGDGTSDIACEHKPDYGTPTHLGDDPQYQTGLWVGQSQSNGAMVATDAMLPFVGFDISIDPMSVADYDRDGRDDLMFLDFNPEDVAARRAGDTASPLRYDVVVARSIGGTAERFEFSRAHTPWQHMRGAEAPRLTAADINDDDYPDLVAFEQSVSRPGRTIGILTARTTPQHGTPQHTTDELSLLFHDQQLPTALSDVDSVYSVGDADGDGRADILIASRNEPGTGLGCDRSISFPHAMLTKLLSDGSGLFTVPGPWDGTLNDCRRSVQLADRWNSELKSQELYAADTNGDRLADFLLASNATDQGGVVLRDVVSPGSGLDTERWISADVTGDGRSDMVHIRIDGAQTFIEAVITDEKGNHQYISSHIPPDPGEPSAGHAVLADWKVLDVNGDGRTDLLYLSCAGTSSAGVCQATAEAFVSTGSGWAARRPQRFSWPAATSEATAGDVNGDGRDDLVQVRATGVAGGDAIVHTLLSVADGRDGGAQSFDQPVLDDTYQPTELNGLGAASGWRLADINGDGRSDLVDVRADTGALTVLTELAGPDGRWSPNVTSVPTDQSTGWSDSGQDIDHTDTRTWRVADTNGDGNADLIHLTTTSTGLRVQTIVSTGSGRWVARFGDVAIDPGRRGTVSDRAHWMLGDVDGDHRTDLVHQHVDESELHIDTVFSAGVDRSTGGQRDRWSDEPVTITNYSSNGTRDSQSWKLTDRDGDGRSDLIRVDTSSVEKDPNLVISSVRANRASDLIQATTTSLGATITVTYRSSAEYAPSTPAQSCGLPLGTTRQVVAEIAIDTGRARPNGSVGLPTTRYGYSCPRWSREHRAFLGYEEVVATGLAAANRPAWRYQRRFRQTDQCLTQPQVTAWLDAHGDYVGSVNSYAYNPPGAVPAFDCTLRAAQRRIYGFNAAKLTSSTEYTYDSYGNIGTVTETGADSVTGDERFLAMTHHPAPDTWVVGLPAGSQLHQGGDASGPVLRSTALCYDGDTSLTCTEAPLTGNLSERHDLNRQGLADLEITKYFYDRWGNLAGTRNANKHGSATFFDKTHQYPIVVVNAKLQETHLKWDPVLGLPTDVTDPNNARTHNEYDPFGRLTLSRQQPSGATSHWQYLDLGDPTKQRLRQWTDDGTPDGLWTETRFDGLGRTYEVTREGPTPTSLLTKRFEYADATSNVYRESVWTQGVASYETTRYDIPGRVSQQTHADGTSIQYRYDTEPGSSTDPESTSRTTLRITDERGHTKTLFSDAYGRLTKVTAIEAASAQFTSADYTYNAADELTSTTDPNTNQTIYQYDNRGNLLRLDDPDLGQRSFTYDLNGSVKTQTDARNHTITWAYDELERPASKTYPNHQTITWTYDEAGHGAGIGRLTSVHDLSGSGCPDLQTEKRSYDSAGQVTSQTKCIEGRTFTSRFAFDTIGRIKTITYPDDQEVTYTYNGAGNLDTMPGFIDKITYNGNGLPENIAYANGTTAINSYDPERLWITGTNLSSTTGPLYQSTYQYEPNGLVKSSTSTTNHMNTAYTYDDLNRLTSATGDTNEEYRYDAAGNMQYSTSAGTYGYPGQGPRGCTSAAGSIACPAPHGPSTVGTATLRYDPNGNLSSSTGPSPSRNLSVDWTDDQQPSIVSADGTDTRLVYDHAGRTVVRDNPTDYHRFYNPYVEYSQTRGLIKHYFAGTRLVADSTGSNTRFFQLDNLGSVRLEVGSDGNVVDRVDYTPFGTVGRAATTPNDPLWFGGGRTDASNRLVDMGARQYDPQSAHFLSPDTIIPDPTNTQALNRYAYAYNAPTSYTDPSGHEPIEVTSTYEPGPSVSISAAGADLSSQIRWMNVADGNGTAATPVERSNAHADPGSFSLLGERDSVWNNAWQRSLSDTTYDDYAADVSHCSTECSLYSTYQSWRFLRSGTVAASYSPST